MISEASTTEYLVRQLSFGAVEEFFQHHFVGVVDPVVENLARQTLQHVPRKLKVEYPLASHNAWSCGFMILDVVLCYNKVIWVFRIKNVWQSDLDTCVMSSGRLPLQFKNASFFQICSVWNWVSKNETWRVLVEPGSSSLETRNHNH